MRLLQDASGQVMWFSGVPNRDELLPPRESLLADKCTEMVTRSVFGTLEYQEVLHLHFSRSVFLDLECDLPDPVGSRFMLQASMPADRCVHPASKRTNPCVALRRCCPYGVCGH